MLGKRIISEGARDGEAERGLKGAVEGLWIIRALGAEI